jgi:rhamnogalacturonan endolyase
MAPSFKIQTQASAGWDINFPLTEGFLEFSNVDGGIGGTRTLRFRYALGVTTSRTGRLIVNGVSQNLTFNPTGAWTTWSNLQVIVNLNSGTGNTVRLESTGQDLANIDDLQVQ